MLETLEILQPTLKFEENTPTYGRLSLEPLDRGYGMTLGNALRRVLLSSIGGAAITAVRIDGVLHEFSTIQGVREDVIEILMNLKHIPVRSKSSEVHVIPVDIQKTGVVTAADIPADSEVEFIDPKAKICTMEKGAHLVMELYIEQGTGYLSAERARPAFLPVDALLTDAIFSPVLRVNYRVEAARVGQRTDYERLTLEVWTNGILTPDKAVGEAAQIVQTYFGHIVDNIEEAAANSVMNEGTSEEDEEDLEPMIPVGDDEFLARPVHELEFSIRSENCLLRGGIQTIGDLLQSTRDDLLKIRNLGKISLTEIEERLTALGLKLREKKKKSAAAQPADEPEPESEPELAEGAEEEAIPAVQPEPEEQTAQDDLSELEKPKAKAKGKTKAKTKQTKQADNAEEKVKEE